MTRSKNKKRGEQKRETIIDDSSWVDES
jgi:hypothetical protein